MKLSNFGNKLTQHSGILQLMDDLGKALSGQQQMLMLGGGNPAHIPAVEKIWRESMQNVLNNGDQFEKMLGNYTTQQGDDEFIKAMAALIKKNYGWNVSSKNIAIFMGSQTAFFFLFNMLAGEFSDGSKRKILLPIVPEYIGYADQGIASDLFTAVKPKHEFIDDHTFKYHIDFEKLSIDESIAAICISRPTNPTGNVITDSELEKLRNLAKEHSIPLIIDNAYGQPFPGIIFSDVSPQWDENMINVMSLSKIGLPGTRTSIVIANEEIIDLLCKVNAIASLAPTNIGQHLMLPLVQSGEVIDIAKNEIRPYYHSKSKEAIRHFHSKMDQNIPYYLHKSEGALFLWLWCKDLPISSQELYQRLKKRGVLVVPGHYFFPGFEDDWQHKQECIRITYSQNEDVVLKGLDIIAEEVIKLYK